MKFAILDPIPFQMQHQLRTTPPTHALFGGRRHIQAITGLVFHLYYSHSFGIQIRFLMLGAIYEQSKNYIDIIYVVTRKQH